jgi:hypothetical protein
MIIYNTWNRDTKNYNTNTTIFFKIYLHRNDKFLISLQYIYQIKGANALQ